MFALFKPKNPYEQQAAHIYGQLLDHIRQPVFYERYSVPDTFEGRFDLLVLHVFLYLERLIEAGEDTRSLRQSLFDAMFADMDQTLREAGIGDMGVPKHMKRMMKAFNGRMHAYEEALKGKDEVLAEAMRRNLYGDEEVEAGEMVHYVRAFYAHLKAQPIDKVLSGEVSFHHG